jgi:hypothetical protein
MAIRLLLAAAWLVIGVNVAQAQQATAYVTYFTLGATTINLGLTTSTVTSLTLSNPTLSGTVAGTPTFSGAVTFSSSVTVGAVAGQTNAAMALALGGSGL